MCSDAFQYIWTKRQFVGEMLRAIDGGGDPGAVMINHTHNSLAWSPSHGQPLDPAGYEELFETIAPRIFGEAGLLDDVVGGGPLDLGRRDPRPTLDTDPALTIVATRHPDVFRPHTLVPIARPNGEFRINPLYSRQQVGDRLHLPDRASIDLRAIRALEAGGIPGDVEDLVRRRVIVDLPKHYY
jgi:hypothetical protein